MQHSLYQYFVSMKSLQLVSEPKNEKNPSSLCLHHFSESVCQNTGNQPFVMCHKGHLYLTSPSLVNTTSQVAL